jgi:hypothetical protein
MKLISKQTIASYTASVSFTSIPQTYTDLVLIMSARHAGTSRYSTFSFNGDSANFSMIESYGNGSSVGNSGPASTGNAGWQAISTDTANTFSNIVCTIPNYTLVASKYFSIDNVVENNGTTGISRIEAGLWSGTAAALTSLAINAADNFVPGSVFSLYGITHA